MKPSFPLCYSFSIFVILLSNDSTFCTAKALLSSTLRILMLAASTIVVILCIESCTKSTDFSTIDNDFFTNSTSTKASSVAFTACLILSSDCLSLSSIFLPSLSITADSRVTGYSLSPALFLCCIIIKIEYMDALILGYGIIMIAALGIVCFSWARQASASSWGMANRRPPLVWGS